MKDTSIIPQGPYCYTWIETPSKENNYVLNVITLIYIVGFHENQKKVKKSENIFMIDKPKRLM